MEKKKIYLSQNKNYSANNETLKNIKIKYNIPLSLIKYSNILSLNYMIYPMFTKKGLYISKLIYKTISNKISLPEIYAFTYFYKRNKFYREGNNIYNNVKMQIFANTFQKKTWIQEMYSNTYSSIVSQDRNFYFYKKVKCFDHMASYKKIFFLSKNILYSRNLKNNIFFWKRELYNNYTNNM